MNSEQIVFFLVTGCVFFIIGLSKGGLGGALGALATPILALILPTDQVIGLLLPFLIVADMFALALHWRKWNRRMVLILLPGAVVGISIGTLLITNSPTGFLRLVLGVIVLIFAVYKLLERSLFKRLVYRPRTWHGVLAGTVSGFSSSLAHTGGPPVSIYLLLQDVTPRVFIATSVLFFAVINLIKVPYYFYAGLFHVDLLTRALWLLPLLPAGVWVGRWAAARVSKESFDMIILIVLILSALLLIFT
ncbi:MAG: sulfite exporter TauE/SafE family protein [Anaerolineales bacterium]|nr:sulfite exporter TauE/SafE family protein [Anaerolineales bacterium]